MGAYIYYPEGTVVGDEFDNYLTGTDAGQMILGFGGNDTLRGFGGSDGLYGYEGNDSLEGGTGNDYLDGGLHNDTVSYFNTFHGVIANLEFGTAKTLGAGPVDDDTLVSIENITGSFYNDHFQGNELHNVLDGVAGDDVLLGWGGDDFLLGGFGVDFASGGEANDRVSGGFGNDNLQGNNGFDALDYSYAYQGMVVSLTSGTSRTIDQAYYVDSDTFSGFEKVIGSQFDDALEGDGLANALEGGMGRDRLAGLGGNDTLDGGEGDDTLDGGAGSDAFLGGEGLDWIDYRSSTNSVGIDLSTGWGTLGDALWDTYSGMEGIFGSDHAGGDILTGNDLSNWLVGMGGNDVMRALGGQDTLNGGTGIDLVDGGDGDDVLNGGDGADTLDGGAGIDTGDFNPSFGGVGPEGPGVEVNLRTGTASGLGNDGERVFNIENVIGTSFDDLIIADDARNVVRAGVNQDTVRGGGGNDHICGNDGDDVLLGENGVDQLIGGHGRDAMTGGLGNDNFVFRALGETGTTAATRDMIRDFAKGEDLIGLSGIDANTALTGDQAFTFIDDDAFSAAGQLRSFLAGANTIVEGDIDGDAVADFQILLNGTINLSVLDFTL